MRTNSGEVNRKREREREREREGEKERREERERLAVKRKLIRSKSSSDTLFLHQFQDSTIIRHHVFVKKKIYSFNYTVSHLSSTDHFLYDPNLARSFLDDWWLRKGQVGEANQEACVCGIPQLCIFSDNRARVCQTRLGFRSLRFPTR